MIWSHPTRPRRPSERVYPKIGIEPKKSCISIYLRFFAEPNEPKEPKLDALTIQHRCHPSPVTPSSTFFSSAFQSFTDPKIGVHPTPLLTSNRRDAHPTQTPPPALPAHSRDRQNCVTKSRALPAMPNSEKDLSAHYNYPQLSGIASQRPAPFPISPAKGL